MLDLAQTLYITHTDEKMKHFFLLVQTLLKVMMTQDKGAIVDW